METGRRVEGLIDFITERYGRAAEIGIGRFPDVALRLLRGGVSVFATDIRPYVHEGLDVFLDDVTAPDHSLYRGTGLIYSMRTPAELFPYIAGLAKTVSADAIVKPLSSEYPEGWIFMKHGNSTFFINKNCCVPAFNLASVIPACLPAVFLEGPVASGDSSALKRIRRGEPRRESFFSDQSHLLRQKEGCWTSQHDMKKGITQ